MKFSNSEIKDLIFAGIIISIAFAFLLVGGYSALSSPSVKILIAFPIAFFTAGTGFLLHELMHKAVAQRYHLFAEFRAFYPGLWIALGMSLFGFILAAPGAVVISGYINKERNGKISLAGPLTNIILAVFFLVGFLLIPTAQDSLLKYFLSYGLSINAMLAAFNMIPIQPFDGSKIIAWNKSAYWITLIIAAGLFFISAI